MQHLSFRRLARPLVIVLLAAALLYWGLWLLVVGMPIVLAIGAATRTRPRRHGHGLLSTLLAAGVGGYGGARTRTGPAWHPCEWCAAPTHGRRVYCSQACRRYARLSHQSQESQDDDEIPF